ncbi:nose resistant to fluoxetine protein 6-like [Sitophilus oryzae]|uniref:Nose resistant to fluoxetine protein 6-like n=1 Tax=Sitophilus oryzae TaxID=7048 RepID=A0A6J2X8B0_SITOR|nr:nose resistant to fluoxetine protein 6-like [Sitophilus oryzae]
MTPRYCKGVFFALIIVFGICAALETKYKNNDSFLKGGNLNNIFQLYVPTVYSENEKCREHSVFYLEELKKLTLWATEMFDASAKFPSGLLYGSSYDLGSYDECLKIKVLHNNEGFIGKYCLVNWKIKLETPHNLTEVDWERDDYIKYFNVSTNDKLSAYANTLSRFKRNDYNVALCLPSSCTYNDINSAINSIILREKTDPFKLEVSIKEQDCQTQDDLYNLSLGDYIFILFFLTYIFIILMVSIYYKITVNRNSNKNGVRYKIVKCLALASNTKKLLNVNQENIDGLQYISAIKVITMFLIIFAHRLMFFFSSPIENPVFVEELYKKVEASVLLNGPIVVDTFFVTSGFLATYLILQQAIKHKTVNFFWVYLHRYLRLLFMYVVILVFHNTLLSKLGSGPLWKRRVEKEMESCRASWWTNILFINNYVNTNQVCMFQTWYLACEFQYFLIAPCLVWMYRKNSRLGYISISLLIVSSISIASIVHYVNNYNPFLLIYNSILTDPTGNDQYKHIYIPSHLRASPYLVGILVAFIKHEIKTRGYKLKPKAVYAGWIGSTFMLLAVVYGSFIFYVPEIHISKVVSSLFASMHHLIWGASIGWMIIAITEGHSGIIKPLTSWKPGFFLNRINYSAYILHGTIQLYSVGTLRSPVYISVFNMLLYALGDIMASYYIGFFLTVFFESPIIQLESLLRKNKFGKEENCDAENYTKHHEEKPGSIMKINGINHI